MIVLTARDAWHERVDGLQAGADDYLGKPFHTQELLARISAVCRRQHGKPDNSLSWNGVTLNTDTQTATNPQGRNIELTGVEFRLLRYLLQHPEEVLSKTRLTGHLYEDSDRDGQQGQQPLPPQGLLDAEGLLCCGLTRIAQLRALRAGLLRTLLRHKPGRAGPAQQPLTLGLPTTLARRTQRQPDALARPRSERSGMAEPCSRHRTGRRYTDGLGGRRHQSPTRPADDLDHLPLDQAQSCQGKDEQAGGTEAEGHQLVV